MLRYKADIRTLTFVGIYYAISILSWIYFPESWYGRLFVVAINCFWAFVMSVIVHNTIHSPIFKKREHNKFFQFILSWSYGHSVSAFVPGHNYSHHKYTQTERDRANSHNMHYKINALNQFMLFFHIAPLFMRDEKVFAAKMLREKPKWAYQYYAEMALVIGGKLILLILDWQKTLLIFIIPHLYAVWGIVGTNYWQHDGTDEEHKYNHSRTFKGWFLNFITCNNGYHGAHHDKPTLHWSKLPEYHKEHVQPYLHPNLNRYSLFTYIIEAYIYPAKRLDYLGNPVVPKKMGKIDWIDGLDVKKESASFGGENKYEKQKATA